MDTSNIKDLIVVKRSGQRVAFNGNKIAVAIKHAFDSLYENYDEKDVNLIYESVLDYIFVNYKDRKTINVEDIQNIIEDSLKKNNFFDVFATFNEYRLRRSASREVFSVKQQHKFVKAIEKIVLAIKNDKIEQPTDIMLNFATTVSNEFAKAYLLDSKYVRANEEGLIYINDLDYYALGTTSSSCLDFSKSNILYTDDYINKITNVLINLKNEQYGEHLISNIDISLKQWVIQLFKSIYKDTLYNYLKLEGFLNYINFKKIEDIINKLITINVNNNIFKQYINSEKVLSIFVAAYDDSYVKLKKDVYFNLLNLLTNLDCTVTNMNNKYSISLGLDSSREGNLINECYIDILINNDIKNVDTIFKVGNLNFSTDNNIHNLLHQIYEFMIHKHNIKLLVLNKDLYNEFEYFSSSSRLPNNIVENRQDSNGKILLSTTTINLGRLGMKYNKNTITYFYDELEEIMELTKNQLLQRFEIQSSKYKENFNYLFKNSLLLDSDKLEDKQKVKKVLKNGSLNIGFVGLIECVYGLMENKNELTNKDFNLALDIVNFMNLKCKQFSNEYKINFSLSEIYDCSILKHLLAIDKSIFGIVKNITDKDAYLPIYTIFKNLNFDEKEQFTFESKYQNIVGSVSHVNFKLNESYEDFIEKINLLSSYDIKYVQIEVGDI